MAFERALVLVALLATVCARAYCRSVLSAVATPSTLRRPSWSVNDGTVSTSRITTTETTTMNSISEKPRARQPGWRMVIASSRRC